MDRKNNSIPIPIKSGAPGVASNLSGSRGSNSSSSLSKQSPKNTPTTTSTIPASSGTSTSGGEQFSTINNIKKSGSITSFSNIFNSQGNRMRMSYSPSDSSSNSSSYSTSPNFTTSPFLGGSGGIRQSSSSYSSLSSSSSSFSPIPSPKGLYKPSPSVNTEMTMGLSSSPSPNIYLKPSPSSANFTNQSPNSFFKPVPTPTEVYRSTPKTKTVGFAVPSSATAPVQVKKEEIEEEGEVMDIDFGTAEDSSSDEEALDNEEEDYEREDEENEEDFYDVISPPATEALTSPTLFTSPKDSSLSSEKKSKYLNLESLTNTGEIEKVVLEGWKDPLIQPRNHQKEACTLILQDVYNNYKKSKDQLDKEIFKIPMIKSEFKESIVKEEKDVDRKTTTTTTTTSSSSTSKSPPTLPVEHSTRNYLIQHAAGSGKSLTIACLVYNLYRLLEAGKRKYDLILVLNDRRHLDTQLGNIIGRFLKDNDCSSIHYPNTVSSLEKLLVKGKTRVIVATMQKFTNLIDKADNKFDKISSKYNSIALISDEAHRSHGKAMSRNIHSILTGDSRQNSNITYFCFTCTPSARCLEMFGETKGNLKVPFHCYTLEKALQDKLVLSVVDNYTTVSILTKIDSSKARNNVNSNSSKNKKKSTLSKSSMKVEPKDEDDDSAEYDELKTSYHLSKNAQNDKKVIQEKANYILKHFTKLCETVNNSDYKCRAMLVTSSRNQILLYKTLLEQGIKHLPKEKRFDIVATFSPFIYRKKVKMDSDILINGKYAKYLKKRDGLSEIIRKDKKKHNIQMLIVADKLQTGFDEPSLGVMYVDKPLKGANAVQTLGRLSRLAKGKKASYVVDFVNSRKDISDSFSQYWRETQLKGATRKTVLEIKLNRLFNKFSDIEPFSKGRIPESVEYILSDDERRRKEKKQGSLTDDISKFVGLCNQLFWDNTTSPMNVRFLESVKFGVCNARSKTQLHSIRGLLRNIEHKSSFLGESTAKIDLEDSEGQPFTGKYARGKHRVQLSTSDTIIDKLNRREEQRAYELLKHNDGMELDADSLEFAKEIWASNPDFKLRSSMLAPLTPEEMDYSVVKQEKLDSTADHEDVQGLTKYAKLFFEQNSTESTEELMDIVVDFMCRTGGTYDSTMTKVFTFAKPSNSQYPTFKSKLDQKLHERHQKDIQIQLQIKLEQHNQMLKASKDTDIVMSDSNSSSNNNSASNSLKSSMNIPIADVPLPAPLPAVPNEAVIGKPHSAGRNDDCLLDDCILSFCHDLESKEVGVRVYAVQTLTQLSNKGIHKNNMHEIVSSINKLLLNRQENISLKMIALDLLATVAVNDEMTVNQIMEYNITQTVLKLISSAEEPIKAKSCKFFSLLANDVSIVSGIIENQGIPIIIGCLDSFDYYVTEHALKLLISLTNEDRTVKLIRSNIDPTIWVKLEHHKILVVNELSQVLRSLIAGSKRTLTQFQPINTKRIRPTQSLLTKSN